MTIDEAIDELKRENGYYANNGMTDVAEFNTKIIIWLEEFKELKKSAPNRMLYMNGFKAGYNKAIDDFAILMKETLNLAEQLKVGAGNGTDN